VTENRFIIDDDNGSGSVCGSGSGSGGSGGGSGGGRSADGRFSPPSKRSAGTKSRSGAPSDEHSVFRYRPDRYTV